MYYKQDTKCTHIPLRPNYPSEDSCSLLLQFLLYFYVLLYSQNRWRSSCSQAAKLCYTCSKDPCSKLYGWRRTRNTFDFLRHAQILHNAPPATLIQNNANKVVCRELWAEVLRAGWFFTFIQESRSQGVSKVLGKDAHMRWQSIRSHKTFLTEILGAWGILHS